MSSEYGTADGPRWERTELRNCWVSWGFGDGVAGGTMVVD